MRQLQRKKTTALLLALCMLISAIPVFAATGSADNVWIPFDDIATNGVPMELTVSGSSNNRVIEDGRNNKVLSLDVGYVSNEVTVAFPDSMDKSRYVVQFDAGFVTEAASGKIALKTASGGEIVLLNIDEDGGLSTQDGRQCGGIGNSGRRNIAIQIDNIMQTYSVYIDKKGVLSRWELDASAVNATMLSITAGGDSKVKSSLQLDNIRVYEGDSLQSANRKASYNSEIIDFVETDESTIEEQVFVNARLDTAEELDGVSVTEKTNRIEQLFEDENGYLEMEKLSGTDNLFADINLNTTVKKLVLECDLRYESTPAATQVFYLRDATGTAQVNKSVVQFNEGSITVGGRTVSLRKNQWNTLSMVLDLSGGLFDFYVNGTLAAEDVNTASGLQTLSLWRVYIDNNASPGKIQFDNFRVYEGTEIRDIGDVEIEEKSIYSDEEALAALRGKTALSPYADVIWTGNQKQKTDVPCITEGDEALVSADTFEKLFGVETSISGDTITAGSARFTVGSAEMQVGGETYTIEAAPRMENGQVMIPARAYGINVLGERFLDDGHGMFLVSSGTIASGNYQEANQYLFFTRYSKEELAEKFSDTLGGDLNKHPRVLADAEDFARLKEEVKTDSYKKEWYESILEQADGYAAETEAFSDYDVSSGRLTDISAEAIEECASLGMAYQLTGEQKYADRAIKVMEKVCSYPDWYPEHTLGTGEMSLAVAIGYDWCYAAMTEDQRESIVEKAMELGLGAGYDVYYGLATYNNRFWGKTNTNWGGHVNGGLIALAASIAEIDMDYTMQSMANSLRSMEYSIYEIAPDGAWHEGPSYWSYYFGPLAAGLAAYETVIGEVHEAVNCKGMDGMLPFQEQVSGPTGRYNNYNDAAPGTQDSVARAYIASRQGRPDVMKKYAENTEKGLADSMTEAEVFALLWYDTSATNYEISAENEAELDAYFRGETELVSMRQNWDSANALWASMTGGISNTSHSHLDSGSFVFAMDGVVWATDLGTESGYYSRTGGNEAVNAGYTNQHYYRRKAEGHNMVVINPDEDLEIDPDAQSEFGPLVSGIGRAYTSIDLTETYGEEVESYLRGYLVSDGRRSFTVRDEIELAKEDSELYWFMNTDGEILVLDNNTAVITQDGKQLYIQVAVEGEDVSYELTKMPKKRLIDLGFTEMDNTGEKLTIRLNADGEVNITVKMSMRTEVASQTPPETTPIAQWSVEGDDTIVAAESTNGSTARLDDIKVNGTSLYGFDPEVFAYTLFVAEDSDLPEISLENAGKSEILTYPQQDGSVVAELQAYDEAGEQYTPYIVTVKRGNALDIDGYSTYQTLCADVSSEQTTATTSQNNLRQGSYDGDMTTRWSALGSGEWIVHDLGAEVDVDAVAVAFYQGDTRIYNFDILVSVDGETFTEVLKDQSNSGTTSDPEVYSFGSTLKVRYIKYIGYGNSVNEWNNVVELVSLKKK